MIRDSKVLRKILVKQFFVVLFLLLKLPVRLVFATFRFSFLLLLNCGQVNLYNRSEQ